MSDRLTDSLTVICIMTPSHDRKGRGWVQVSCVTRHTDCAEKFAWFWWKTNNSVQSWPTKFNLF